MTAPDTARKPRITLERGDRASGQIAVGPNNFWRVPLDEATLEWDNQLLVLSGKETRLEAHGESVVSCVQQFWDGFCEMRGGIKQGTWDLDWLPNDDARWLYALIMEDRFHKVTASPPAAKDGEEWTLFGEFWDGHCPVEKNVRTARMITLDW